MFYNIKASCCSFIGTGRDVNEDNFYFNKKHLPASNKGLKKPISCKCKTDEHKVFALFDGMGGGSMGNLAACVASEVFSDHFKKSDELVLTGKEFMYNACEAANKSINDVRIEKHLTTIGCTVAALWFSQDEVVACNMGDSKIFRIRDNKMIQISDDHTDEKIMSAMGIYKKPVLLQYLGVPDTEMTIEPYISKGDLMIDDIYVMCTDGVTDVLSVNEIYDVVMAYEPETAAENLISAIKGIPSTDNSTVIIVKVVS